MNQAKPKFLARLKKMMNFDMVGANDRLLLDGSGTLSAIAKFESGDISSSRFGGSDRASFRAKDIPTSFFFRGKDPNYHSPKDKIVDPCLLEETPDIALKLILKILTPDRPQSR